MLIKVLAIILVTITNVFSATAEYKKVWRDLYDPTSKIRDIVFDLKSDKIEQLLKDKLVTSKVEDLILRYYWIESNQNMEVINKEKLPEETVRLIKGQFLDKIELVIGSSFEKFINGYDYVGIKHSWYTWEDPTGLKDVSSFKMKRTKKLIEIIQKKATGTTKTKYYLKRTTWSKKKYVVWKVEKNIYEGAHNISINGRLTYSKKNNLWLPKKLKIETRHNLNKTTGQDYTRTIVINYEFSNYKVNTAEALRWFSTR